MVDINNLYDKNTFDNLVFQQSPINHIDDGLDNIDENDLFNFNSCQDLKQLSPFFIETPPETPINNHYCAGGSPKDNSVATNQYSENLLDFNQNYHEHLEKQSTSSNDSNDNFALRVQPPLIPLSTNRHTTLPSSFDYLNNDTPLFVNCLSPSFGLKTNCTDSNGYLVDPNLKRNTKVFNNNLISQKNNIQPKAILPSKVSNSKLKKDVELELILKKQKLEARKLRNREAALNSRMKKKEYVENLEAQCSKLAKENNDLRLENAVLKEKMKELEHELGKFRSLDSCDKLDANKKKAKISFYAVVFMLFLQISPYFLSISPGHQNLTILSHKNALLKSSNNHHLSRTILWNSDNKELSEEDYFQFQDAFNTSSDLNRTTKCNDYYNRTELIRLENELRGWLTRFKLEENESRRRYQIYRSKRNSKKLLYDLKHVPIPRLKLWIQKQRYIDYINDELDQNIDQFFPFDLENLMSKVRRRDDTFYYLSYPSKGHLILPPMSNRTDLRPRFSFLIPTFYNFSLNNTTGSSQINHQNETSTALTLPQLSMLQIDCQVINTKVSLVDSQSKKSKYSKVSRKTPTSGNK